MEQEEDQELGSVTFAATLEAADKPTDPDAQFSKFSSLPLELRIAIWNNFLPTLADEPGAIFIQTHSEMNPNYCDYGQVYEPPQQVPIRMSTTSAALLHVNKESRYLVLRWAESLGYELCFRVCCSDVEDLDDLDDDDSEEDSGGTMRILPVCGPIFIRPWNPDKDILDIIYSSDYDGYPDEWAETYVEGEKVHNIQHLAISIADLKSLLRSQWFYHLLCAMPDLRSVSIDFEPLTQGDAETFRGPCIKVAGVGDPWTALHGPQENRNLTTKRPRCVDCRWEPDDPKPEDVIEFEKLDFKNQLLKGFLDEDYWPQGGGAWEFYRDEDGNLPNIWERAIYQGVPGYEHLEPKIVPEKKAKILESLPPWIWDHDKDEFAFELRAFQPIERRGYDDVGGGFTARCAELYAI